MTTRPTSEAHAPSSTPTGTRQDPSGTGLTRRALGAVAVAAAATAGCSRFSSSSGGGGSAGVELSFSWWGDATRAAATAAAVDTFTRKNPGITVRTDYQDAGPYQDKLATRIAAGDPPDVMAVPNRSLREYADRGALADLATTPVDLSRIPDGVLDLGRVDGRVHGAAAGLNTLGVALRRGPVLAAGLPLPDGDTWSWEDYEELCRAVTESTGGALHGSGYSLEAETGNIVWSRQQGQDFYAADGTLGSDAATLAGWYEMNVRMRAVGALPPPGRSDVAGAGAEQSLLALGAVASQFFPTNNFAAYQRACDGDLELLRLPGETTSTRRGMSVDCSQLWALSAQSDHPEEAALLLDFLLNDPDAYAEMMTTRGVPANPDVTAAVKADMDPDDLRATEFLEALQTEDLAPTHPYPRGASAVATEISSLAVEIEFGRVTPGEAAQRLLDVADRELEA